MKKSKSVDSHKLADLFKEQPINQMSPCIGTLPGGSTLDGVIVIAIGIIILAMLIGSLVILCK